MSSENDLRPLVTRAMGLSEAERALAYSNPDVQVLGSTARQLMEMTPITPGACVLMSAAWALHLRDKYDMPAVAVTGDLKVGGRWVFRAPEALPEFRKSGQVISMSWRGHCWVEVGGLLCDISIFRTVYNLAASNATRQFFENMFGIGRGALIVRADELPDGLKYRRRAVMNVNQMAGCFEGLRHMIEGEGPG